jgi:transmembrane sensor
MNTRIEYLYQQYIDDNCTEAEREEFFSLLSDEAAAGESLNELLDQTWNQLDVYQNYEQEQAGRILNGILVDHPKPVVNRLSWLRYVAAAAAVLVLGFGIYFYTTSGVDKPVAELAQETIAPGSNKAVLTLANGTVINLDETANGEIAQQAGIVITKTADGQLVYDVSQSAIQRGKTNDPVINTISTPKGGQYQINLPDGTKVWLNAASSLKYPAIFTGKERRVELTGEAYFEVTHHKDKPFRVKSTVNGVNQEIEVLGTHFNINAYPDEEAVRTTLLEGSVRVSSLQGKTKNEVLKPGQQSVLDKASNNIKVAEVDTEEAVAWKSGLFQFNEADLPSITRQLARWYNIDIVFEGKPANDLFHFKISKNLSLTQLLKIFETNGINFKIEGRKLIVKS